MIKRGINKPQKLNSKIRLLLLIVSLLVHVAGCEDGGDNTDPNAGTAEFMHISEVVNLPCDIFFSNTLQSEVVQCTFPETQYPLSLTQFIDELNAAIGGLGFEITDDARIWIEAVGGRGGKGSNGIESGGLRGSKGYARTATTIGYILNNLLADGDSLYILIGEKGQRKAGQGGSGGASTVVIGKDILDVEDVFDPEGELLFLIAGGGGGGGKGGGLANRDGGNGGGGADSVATLTAHASDDGGNGGGGGKNGEGGNKDGLGTGGDGAVVGTGGIGGYGGIVRDRPASDWGLDIVWEDGHGGKRLRGDEGGAGGGGFGGGGGAGDCKDNACGAGAGGGGSWARRATVENLEGSFLGKDKMPGNNDNGAVVITIETFSN